MSSRDAYSLLRGHREYLNMACDTDQLYRIDSNSSKDRWIASIVFWLGKWRRKMDRKQDIKKLLTCDERVLDDIGLRRAELVSELGYDPQERPPLYGASVYPNPYVGYGSVISSNHRKRRR